MREWERLAQVVKPFPYLRNLLDLIRGMSSRIEDCDV